MKRILIGGSGSTGSSLLNNILGRTEGMFAGQETALFTKKLLFTQWDKQKRRILKRFPQGLISEGYHAYRGTDLIHPSSSISIQMIKSLIHSGTDLFHFADQYFNEVAVDGLAGWVEKTPANSFCFGHFLSSSSDHMVIHIVRNPLDTLLSLIDRGYDPVYAGGIYLLNTSAGLRWANHNQYYQIKYEDIVNNPGPSFKRLFDFLGLKWDLSILDKSSDIQPWMNIKSWNADESGPIEKNLKNFNKAPKTMQTKIWNIIHTIQSTSYADDRWGLPFQNISQISRHLGYSLKDYSFDSMSVSPWKNLIRLQYMTRLLKGHGSHPLLKLKG